MLQSEVIASTSSRPLSRYLILPVRCLKMRRELVAAQLGPWCVFLHVDVHCTHALYSPSCKLCSTKLCRLTPNTPSHMRWIRNRMTNFHYLQVKRGWLARSSLLPHQPQRLSHGNRKRNQFIVDHLEHTHDIRTTNCSLPHHCRTNRRSFPITISTIFKPLFQICPEDGMAFSMRFPSHPTPSRRALILTLRIHLVGARCWMIAGPHSCIIITS